MVVGEAQILGQLREAYSVAAEAGTVGRVLHELAQQALRVGKRVHADTGIDTAGSSVVSEALADAATELSAARALLYSTAWAVMQGDYPVAEISMCKKYCAQVQNRLVDTCVQVWGGAGYLEETGIPRAFRDARLQRIGGGTDEIMNEVIAKRLLGE